MRFFVEYLIREKGYPKGSILLEASLADNNRTPNRYVADLILLDTEFNNYLALVEFKSKLSKPTIDSLRQVKTYLNIIDIPNLPAYLVLPRITGEITVDFIVYILDNDDWKEIDKVDFPHYETLSSKNKADEKKEFKDLNEIKHKAANKKKELIKSTAYSTLASLIAGVIATFILSEKIFFQEKTTTYPVIKTYCDSVKSSHHKLSYKIASLEKSIKEIKQQDSIIQKNGSNVKIADLNHRISNIENLINQTPERLLKIQEVTFQIQALKAEIESEKQLSETKISNVKERIDQLTIWTSGLIITIIGSIIGFAVNAFRKS